MLRKYADRHMEELHREITTLSTRWEKLTDREKDRLRKLENSYRFWRQFL
ncbi:MULTISPECIES: hypothetical protein [unclassified Roseibium]|jgi:hypothetical protein